MANAKLSGTRIIVVPFDQLSRDRGAMRDADPRRDVILMVRSRAMMTSRVWHAQRLHLVLSAAAHHAQWLRSQGFDVIERDAESVSTGLVELRVERPEVTFVATAPRSRALLRHFKQLGVELVPDDSFLTPQSLTEDWSEDSLPVMETFYRQQRARLNVLMDGDRPLGGRWNFDEANRLPPPKGNHNWPVPLRHEFDAIDERVWQELLDGEAQMVGSPPDGTWGTTREGALAQLQYFVSEVLPEFGPYEDAIPADTWTVNHSLLSTYLNIGLLDPDEVLAAALAEFELDSVPLPSIEGFVRQVIGWREYVNAVYWAVGDDYPNLNALNATMSLPPAFEEPERTSMQCLRSTLHDVHARGWVHHIPRLMILGNLALTAGIDPKELLAWMRRMFVDASDWVMEPNVIGMALYADGGKMTTKPYAGGGAYLKRMSRYCKECPFDPSKRTGDDACPFTTLYWDFLNRNEGRFRSNPRMSKQLGGFARLADKDQIPARAREVLAALAVGEL